MDFFSDPQATVSRFRDVIDDLHDVFRCHGVDFGSPDNFFAFGRTMKYHSELRSDVMRVVKFVMESERNVSFRTILTVLAVASGGVEVAASGREMRVPVSLVIESLLGEGDSSLLNAERPESSIPASFSSEPIAKEAIEAVALERSSSGGEAMAGATEAERAFVEEPVSKSPIDFPMDRNPLIGRSDSNALAESLSRLEMNSLQLKLYLDSIEQRISRMEPRLEKVTPVALSVPPAPLRDPAPPGDHAEERFPVALASATVPSEPVPSEIVFLETGAELSRNDPAKPAPRQQGRGMTWLLTVLMHLGRDTLHVTKRWRALPILGGLAMLLLAVSFAWRFGRGTGYVAIRPVNALAQKTNDVGGPSPARDAVFSGGDPLAGTAGRARAAAAGDTSVPHVGKARRDTPAPVDNDASLDTGQEWFRMWVRMLAGGHGVWRIRRFHRRRSGLL